MKALHAWLATKHVAIRVPSIDDGLRHTTHGLHSVYFGSVALEGHGLYAMAGGGLLLLGVVNYFLHFE